VWAARAFQCVIILCPGFNRTVAGAGGAGTGYATISFFSEVETILPDWRVGGFYASS